MLLLLLCSGYTSTKRVIFNTTCVEEKDQCVFYVYYDLINHSLPFEQNRDLFIQNIIFKLQNKLNSLTHPEAELGRIKSHIWRNKLVCSL